MKLAITLIVAGGILIADGGARIILGLERGNLVAFVGGILTGLALGGYLAYRGIKRLLRIKTTPRSVFNIR